MLVFAIMMHWRQS